MKMFSICCTKTFINLYLAQTKLKQRNETKQARLFELASAIYGSGVANFRSQNVNRVYKLR